MTINQYLSRLEVLKIREDRALEKYVRLLERASSPTASSVIINGMPRSKNYKNPYEDILLDLSEAGAIYDKAWRKADAYRKHLERNLDKLDFAERVALEQIYIWNIGKPPEKRRVGVCRLCGCRTKADAAVLIQQAKQHLTEILKEQGIEITMNRQVIEFKGPGGQELHRVSPLQTFATGTINYIEAHFDLSDTWAGYTERLAVWHNERVEKESEIDANGRTVIPKEVMLQPGTLKVNLCFNSIEDDTVKKRLTSNPIPALNLVKANF